MTRTNQKFKVYRKESIGTYKQLSEKDVLNDYLALTKLEPFNMEAVDFLDLQTGQLKKGRMHYGFSAYEMQYSPNFDHLIQIDHLFSSEIGATDGEFVALIDVNTKASKDIGFYRKSIQFYQHVYNIGWNNAGDKVVVGDFIYDLTEDKRISLNIPKDSLLHLEVLDGVIVLFLEERVRSNILEQISVCTYDWGGNKLASLTLEVNDIVIFANLNIRTVKLDTSGNLLAIELEHGDRAKGYVVDMSTAAILSEDEHRINPDYDYIPEKGWIYYTSEDNGKYTVQLNDLDWNVIMSTQYDHDTGDYLGMDEGKSLLYTWKRNMLTSEWVFYEINYLTGRVTPRIFDMNALEVSGTISPVEVNDGNVIITTEYSFY